jgi:hypothetical protein
MSSNVKTHNGGSGDNILPLCQICSREKTRTEAWQFWFIKTTSPHCPSNGDIEVHSR